MSIKIQKIYVNKNIKKNKQNWFILFFLYFEILEYLFHCEVKQ